MKAKQILLTTACVGPMVTFCIWGYVVSHNWEGALLLPTALAMLGVYAWVVVKIVRSK